MKKIVTLLLAALAIGAVHAQTSRDEARRVILGQPKNNGGGTTAGNGRDVILGGGNNNANYPVYPNSYPNNYPNSRQAQIDQVNREYDAKIYSIRNNPYLSAAEKDRAIRQLENDRSRALRQINGQYRKTKKHRDYDEDDDRDEHHDNGKHKGWYKGKGNKHKDD